MGTIYPRANPDHTTSTLKVTHANDCIDTASRPLHDRSDATHFLHAPLKLQREDTHANANTVRVLSNSMLPLKQHVRSFTHAMWHPRSTYLCRTRCRATGSRQRAERIHKSEARTRGAAIQGGNEHVAPRQHKVHQWTPCQRYCPNEIFTQ